jgi:CubicO group peptidase (beta-lactamase class C family)
MGRRFFLLFHCLVSVQLFAQRQQVIINSAEIDSYISQLMKEWGIAGCAVGIVYKDSLVFAKGYGFRNIENKIPVTPKTFFMIASNTKLFTSTAACILQVQKKLDLDKPVRTYMPELKLPTAELDEKLTLRDILSHRSGIPRWDAVWAGAGYTNQELLDRVPYLKPTKGYRETFIYNNIMYSVAGMVCGKIYGSSWQDLIQKEIFSPLEMNTSCFNQDDAAKTGEFGNDYMIIDSNGRLLQSNNAAYFPKCLSPASYVISNVEELSHWVIAQLNDGRYKGRQAIPSAAIKETLYSNNIDPDKFGYSEVFDGGYGLGRYIASYKGHNFLYHGGAMSSYCSEISFLPSDSIGIIVLTNTTPGWYFDNAMVLGIFDIVLQMEKTPWSKRFATELKNTTAGRKRDLELMKSLRVKNTIPSHPLTDYTGTYENALYGDIRITIENNQLFFHFRYTDQPLEHFHYDQFWTKEQELYFVNPARFPIFKLKFLTNDNGKIDKFRTNIINDPETEFIKTSKTSH